MFCPVALPLVHPCWRKFYQFLRASANDARVGNAGRLMQARVSERQCHGAKIVLELFCVSLVGLTPTRMHKQQCHGEKHLARTFFA
jgi:hypothetical protein